MPARVLLEGRPGSGKSTVAARVVELLDERRIPVVGFVTRELRERGRRVGFEVASFDGRCATLAHVDFGGPPRVGKYGVDLDAFEGISLPVLENPPKRGIVVIDELGKMELASKRFGQAILRLFDTPLDIVATVHVFRDDLTDALKRRADVERVQVTRASRDDLPRRIVDRLVSA
jgi:nucleoside-triphosphatase